jgi:hypothetical protein
MISKLGAAVLSFFSIGQTESRSMPSEYPSATEFTSVEEGFCTTAVKNLQSWVVQWPFPTGVNPGGGMRESQSGD